MVSCRILQIPTLLGSLGPHEHLEPNEEGHLLLCPFDVNALDSSVHLGGGWGGAEDDSILSSACRVRFPQKPQIDVICKRLNHYQCHSEVYLVYMIL